MARPDPETRVPSEALAEYERWRNRVLSWPAPVETHPGLRLRDLPDHQQQHVIDTLLAAKALRAAKREDTDHWALAIVDLGDE